MGTTLPAQARPEVQQRLTRAEARTRARQRAEKGELVHLSSPAGSVRVQREGKLLGAAVQKSETVPRGGMTVHAGKGLGSLVSVQPGSSVTIESKSRGRETVTAKKGPESSKLLSLRERPPVQARGMDKSLARRKR
jgi:hypothetical protein